MINTNCHICNKEIQKSDKDFNKSKSGFHFCSRSCSATFNNKIYKTKHNKRTCLNCTNVISQKAQKELFCSYICKIEHNMKNTTISDYLSKGDSTKYNRIRCTARHYSKYFLEPKCAKCGYDKHFEVCHIKDISSFPHTAKVYEVNSKDNLVHLCPNCHWELDNLCKNKEEFLAPKTGVEPVSLD